MNKTDLSSNPSLNPALYGVEGKSTVSSTEPVAIPVVVQEEAQEESSGGAFSKQKGGSAALSLDAYIAAMNAQLEAVKLRRQRNDSMIEMNHAATTLAADYVRDAGRMERNNLILQGTGTIVGGAISLGSAGYTMYSNRSFETNAKKLNAQIEEHNNYIGALDELAAKNPNAASAWVGRHDAMGPSVDGAKNRLLVGEFTPASGKTPVDLRRYKNEDGSVFDAKDYPNFSKLHGQDDATAMAQLTPAQRTEARESLVKKRESLERMVSDEHGKMTQNSNWVKMTSDGTSGTIQGGFQIGAGVYAELKAIYEAQKMQTELVTNYTNQEISLNNENAAQREGDVYNTIRTLQQLTQADIRG